MPELPEATFGPEGKHAKAAGDQGLDDDELSEGQTESDVIKTLGFDPKDPREWED